MLELCLPHPASHHNLGREAYANEDHLLALHHLQQASSGHAGVLWSRQNLGTVLAGFGRHSEAAEWLTPLREQLPKDPWVSHYLAEGALELGNYNCQEPSLRRWLEQPWVPIHGWEEIVSNFLKKETWAPDPDLLLPSWENHYQSMDNPQWQALKDQLHAALPRKQVSVIIPSRDRPDLLGPCLKSLEELGKWGQAESVIGQVVLVDNGSCQARTAKLLQHWQERKGEAFNLLRLDEPFNWSRLSNAGAHASTGSLLLFLNDDTCFMNNQAMGWLAKAALKQTNGPIGALLLDDQGRVADGGLVKQADGYVARWRGWPLRHLPGEACHGAWTSDAITGACLMVRRELWQEVQFDEQLPEDGNDVVFAEALKAKGFAAIVIGAARLLHGVSSSRGVCRKVA